MSKRKGLSYEEKMINALEKLPNPLIDKKHNLEIYFINNRARSNQDRFKHIINYKHSLLASDIERIPRYINSSKLKIDKERKNTSNIYIKRSGCRNEYIKISLKIDPKSPNIAIVKTIFITKVYKW